MIKVTKVLNVINLRNKYNLAIDNTGINVARDLGLIYIKKFKKCTNQIQDKVDWLYKDWIFALGIFVKYFQNMHNNEKIIKNMIIRHEIDLKKALSLFVQLHEFIHYQKIDGKDIVYVTKVVKKLM